MKPLTVRQILGPLASSYWGKRILAAEKRGQFTLRDELSAGQWPTCACGRLGKRIERGKKGEPTDYQLKQLGYWFHDAVYCGDFSRAARHLVAIEARAAELLKEVKS